MTTPIHPDRLALTCAAMQARMQTAPSMSDSALASDVVRMADATLAELRRTEPKPDVPPFVNTASHTYVESTELTRLRAVEEAYRELCKAVLHYHITTSPREKSGRYLHMVDIAKKGTP